MGSKIAIIKDDSSWFAKKPATDIPCVGEFRAVEFALADIA